MPEKILEWLENNQEKFIAISDEIWKFAELGLFEEKSSNLLADTLRKAGFIIKMGVADMPTAFVASYGAEDPIVALLGEYDALPGLSQAAEPIKKPINEGFVVYPSIWSLAAASMVNADFRLKKSSYLPRINPLCPL